MFGKFAVLVLRNLKEKLRMTAARFLNAVSVMQSPILASSMTQEPHSFTAVQWERLALQLPPCKGRPGEVHRIFFNGLLCMAELLHDQRIIDTCLGLGSRAALVPASRRIT